MNNLGYFEPAKKISETAVRTNLTTGFAAISMTAYLWVQLAQVVLPPIA